ncbi:hypothetical protein GSI_12772 [Ganoderma sinense ZZ0214-1]|uniref:Uncharacterized protein n=1 Tax=Ganoderma sinense ZZ0214-1 TaxID=1077348 RepID=A0A2G8RTN9_9APHY|nr:hypothetical protein GSI_12772 [Ganoderma sinense ZZ0214-1]
MHTFVLPRNTRPSVTRVNGKPAAPRAAATWSTYTASSSVRQSTRNVVSRGQAITASSHWGSASSSGDRELVGSRTRSMFDSRTPSGSPVFLHMASDSRWGMCERRGSQPVLSSHVHSGSIHISRALVKTGNWASVVDSSETSSSTAKGSSEAIMMSSQR